MVVRIKVVISSKTGAVRTGDLGFNIRKYGNKITAKERESMQIWANTVIKESKKRLEGHKVTGRLERSIGDPANEGILEVSPKDFSVTVGSKVPYVNHVNYGTRPHMIEAKGKKYLKFKNSARQFIYRRKVKHPGQKPVFFMDLAVIEANRQVEFKLKEPIRL